MPVNFKELVVGATYDRPELARLWGYEGHQAISRGILLPADAPYIVLFITDEKQDFQVQYQNSFKNGILKIEGESSHTADLRIVDTEGVGEEIHLFFRERHHRPFTYKGRLFLSNYQLLTDSPSRFEFTVAPLDVLMGDFGDYREASREKPYIEFVPDEEGRRILRQHFVYERSDKNRRRAIEIHGNTCLACGFNFDTVYGVEHARHYIEVHHVRSITEQRGRPVDPATDLIPLCSNCHRMAHIGKNRILDLKELRRLIDTTG